MGFVIDNFLINKNKGIKSSKKTNNIFIKKIKEIIINKKKDLYKSFLPKTKYSFRYRDLIKFKKYKTIILIGMGGSIMGSKAIYSFLRKKIKKKLIFIDNLDLELVNNIKKKYASKNSLFLAISKSGNTTETLANLSIFKKYFNKKNLIIISEKKNNALFSFAKKNKFYFIEHNKRIGGRYSVFSEVGMVPAILMGLNPVKFKKTLPIFFKKNIRKQILFNQSIFFSKKYRNIILFNYVPQLKDFLFWYQQLLSESLGKRQKGLLPVISSAPRDHHSLLQLYLDGPKDKIFYIFSSSIKSSQKLKLDEFGKGIEFLNKKKYHNVNLSQKNAFKEILKKNKVPFREIKIRNFDEKTLGELFLYFIFETIYLGYSRNINPFDQPAVEGVKILTKKILTSK